MKRIKELASLDSVRAAQFYFRDSCDAIVASTISIQQIPAPTFSEEERAHYLRAQFDAVGLSDVHMDDLQNVYGRREGHGEGPPVIVSAHTDTVFEKGTDLSIRRNGNKLYGPGIADNSLGLAGLLALADVVRRFGIQTERDIWFVANVGEEGLGDLRGMRRVVERFPRAATFIVLEGGLFGYVCHQAIGVRRFRIRAEGPGGHSWGAFGAPSAVHAVGRLIAAMGQWTVPTEPKTTFNVGLVRGGSAINAIAREAEIMVDLRSEDKEALSLLVANLQELVRIEDRERSINLTMEVIGDRPPGEISRKAPIVRAAVEALEAVGCEQIEYTMGSTDANVPLSRGLPAVCVGISRSGNTHRPDEYLEIDAIPDGLSQVLLLTLAAAGV